MAAKPRLSPRRLPWRHQQPALPLARAVPAGDLNQHGSSKEAAEPLMPQMDLAEGGSSSKPRLAEAPVAEACP